MLEQESSHNQVPTVPPTVEWVKIIEGSEAWLYGISPDGDGATRRIDAIREKAAQDLGAIEVNISMNGDTSEEGNAWNRAVNDEGHKKDGGDYVYSVLAKVAITPTSKG